MPQTTFTQVSIGATAGVFTALATTVALYLGGALNIERVVNFVPTGNTTGAILQVNGVTQKQIFTFACANTGGVASYDTCISASPLTTSGAISAISLECGNVPRPFAYDVSFVSAVKTGTQGILITNLNNKTAGTGAFVSTLSGAIIWNPAQFLKLGSLTSVPTTSGNDCVMRVEMFDKYGT